MSRTVPQWIKDKKYHFCAVCGKTEDLQYNHFIPDNGHNTVPENIIVLCAPCHQIWHNQGGTVHHNYLVKQGIAKAKERGVKVGKKPADYEKVMRLIAENSTQFNKSSLTTEHEIMDMAGVKEVCYAKCKRMLLDAINDDEWPYSWAKPTYVAYRPLYDNVIKRLRGDAI
jgi:hypothetical protein